jgi:hypothetical protein
MSMSRCLDARVLITFLHDNRIGVQRKRCWCDPGHDGGEAQKLEHDVIAHSPKHLSGSSCEAHEPCQRTTISR